MHFVFFCSAVCAPIGAVPYNMACSDVGWSLHLSAHHMHMEAHLTYISANVRVCAQVCVML